MDADLRRLIEALHAAPAHCVLAVTGGGASAAGLLLAVPGGSRTVLEVLVPYHEEALSAFLGRRPEQFCSAATSRDMALRAHDRASWLMPGAAVVGLGCTASLVSDRPKRGEHRCHISVSTGQYTLSYSLTLNKGARDREEEENIVSVLVLNALAEAFGLAERATLPLLPGEAVQTERFPAGDALAAFLRGEVARLCAEVDGRLRVEAAPPAALLPGAFNPIHEGHRGLSAVAAHLVGGPAAFELSVVNVDKPPLSAEEVRRRLQQFTWHSPVWLTRAPTFVEKAELFPGVVFVVGVDTAARIVAPRYYQDSEARMLEALDRIRSQGCRFLVAGRADATARFLTLEEMPLPAEVRDLFTAIPESAFHVDISSTQLRQQTPIRQAR